jgi:hypothetical protein
VGRLLQNARTVLQALQSGPKHKVQLRQALLWDTPTWPKLLDRLLQEMRMAGLIEPAGEGLWRIVESCEMCPSCRGKGIREAG